MPVIRTTNDWIVQERQFQCDRCGFAYPISRARKRVLQTAAGGWSGHLDCDKCWDPFMPTNLIGTTVPRERYDYEDVRNLNHTTDAQATAVGVPTLTAISPSATTAAAFLAAPTVTCTGTGFTARSRVQFRYLEAFMVTTYVSATSVTAVVYDGLIAAGSHSVRVINIGPPYRSNTVTPNGVGDNYTATLTMVLT